MVFKTVCTVVVIFSGVVVSVIFSTVVAQALKFQHITPILKSLNWLIVSERIEHKIISVTKFSIPLSHHISMTLYPFSLLMVTTHALHLMSLLSPSSSLKVTHRSFRHASRHLWNQLPTSLRIPNLNYSSPSQRPSFEHAGLTCYTYTAITVHHFFTVSL